MKHRHYTQRIAALILMLTATGIALATPRSVEQARKAAIMQMQKHSANKVKAHGETGTAINPQLVLAKKKQNKNEAYYYVFSAGHDLGYTIVSGDDRLPEIVGYTESGNYDADKLPENLASFMQAYQDFADNATDGQIEEIKEWKAQMRHEPVAPLMEEKWNQRAPYNNMCPEYKYSWTESNRAVTGCTATAISQILHHYGCPDALKEDIPEYTSKITINGYPNEITMPAITAGEQYDWQNMPNVYKGTETQEQKDAVAKLMLHVGCAVKTTYGPSSTASASAETFTKYFGMDKELVRQLFRKDYNISQWDKMLYDELVAGRPVYYDGQSTGGGHAFVVHGYNEGLYYVNWGWGGQSDGYFDITILNPYNTHDAGASWSDDGYSMKNSMIIGITPDNGKVDNVSTAKITSFEKLQVGNISISNSQINATVINSPQNSNLNGKIYISIGYADNNGKYVSISTPEEIDSQKLPQGYYYKGRYSQISFNYEEGRIYKLCLIESTDLQNWTACAGEETTSTSIKIEKQICTVIPQSQILTATAALDTESGGYAGMPNKINITVNNSGNLEYYDKVYVMVSTEETMPEGYTYATGITAPVDGSTTFDFIYTPQTAQTYNFWILDIYGQEIGKSSITFKEATAPELSFVSIRCSNASDEKVFAEFQEYEKVEMYKVNDTKADFIFEIKNDGGYYEGKFVISEYKSGYWYDRSEILKIPGNATTTFKFTIEGNADSTVGIRMVNAGTATITGLTTPNDHYVEDIGYYRFLDCEICYLAGSGSGINDIQADTEKEGAFYNLRGEKVSNPTKGIYIKNGKKYLLK